MSEEVSLGEGSVLEEELQDPLEQGFDEDLVMEIQSRPYLWDTKAIAYKDGIGKTEAWNELSRLFGRPVKDLKRRWKNLRDRMVKTLRKNKEASLNGDTKGFSKCRLFDELLFLKDVVSSRAPPQTREQYLSAPEESDPLSVTITPNADSKTLKRKQSSLGSPRAKDVKRKVLPKEPIPPPSKRVMYPEVYEVPMDSRILEATQPSPSTSSPTQSLPSDVEATRTSNWYFCQSLVETLDAFPKKKNRLAKIKIQELLLNLEFGDYD